MSGIERSQLCCVQYSTSKWAIHHDISGYHEARDCYVTFDQWITYQIGRDDGVPAQHPTLCLVLYTHNICSQLHSQKRVVLNTSDIDANISAKNIYDMLNNAVNNHDLQA